MLRYSLIFLVILFTSCGSRKVAIEKVDNTFKIDSNSVVKKNEVVTTQNNIIIDTNIEECEITPIDSAKPIFIGDKKYFNAKIRYKKTKTNLVDTTKKSEIKKEVQQVKVIKDKKEKIFKKQVDKKESYTSYWPWILVLFLLALYFYVRKEIKKHLL